ncbi:Na+/H+ antiporter NhaA [Actinomycetospora sp.]|uniref:Na+/H+ antiporter NhaA n=1 Tax=Actinomycetospora sp. TaxID=1872135 RepID=UPI002F3F6803
MRRTRTGRLFVPPSPGEASRLTELLRRETVGGALLIGAAVVALVWANTPWRESYTALGALTVGPSALHLDLPLSAWAADGLLAIFFFVAGLELKREFVAGDLREPSRALLPVAAAVGGMVVPAALYAVINHADPEALAGWAVPVATDIAFALAVLAVIGRGLPVALRTFLLTLAVVDDLIAITIIAVVYTDTLAVGPLLLALIPIALFGALVQRRVRSPWLLLPLALLAWALVHASGVHATVAGVLLGFTVPVIRRSPGDGPGLAEHFEHRWRPISAGVAVPVFAFFAAGVTVVGAGFASTLADPVTVGVVVGLVAGKAIGVTGATWLVQRFTRAQLDESLGRLDVLGLALLGGIGFTVSLLVGELAFGGGTAADDHVKIGVVAASVLAAALATLVLRLSARRRPAHPNGEGAREA